MGTEDYFCPGTKHHHRNASSAHCLLIYALLLQLVPKPQALKEGHFLEFIQQMCPCKSPLVHQTSTPNP